MRPPALAAVLALALGSLGCEGMILTEPEGPAIDLASAPQAPRPAPLLLVDGKPFPLERLRELDPGRVQSIEIVKAPAAVRLYGERARAGVIQISLRQEGPSD